MKNKFEQKNPQEISSNRSFPHYAPVSKHKEMRTRLGWRISYKSLYFVHPCLVPLFTRMRERSIDPMEEERLKDILLKAKLQSGGLDYRAGTPGTAVLLLSTNFLKLFVQCI